MRLTDARFSKADVLLVREDMGKGTRDCERRRAENQYMGDRLERAANEHSRNVRRRLAPGIMGP